MKNPSDAKRSFWLFVLCFIFSGIQAQWQFIGSPETGKVLQYDSDANRIYLLATSGLFYSDNSGDSWLSIPLPEYISHANEVYADGGHIYLASRHEYFDFVPWSFYCSDDFGNTWKNIFPYTPDAWSFQAPLIEGDTIIIFNEDSVAISTDRGDTYTKAITSANPGDIVFHNHKLIGLNNGVLFTSLDLGLSWTEESVPLALTNTQLLSFNASLFIINSYVDSLKTFVIISRSDDDGASWSLVGNLNAGYFHAYPVCVGDGQQLFVSSPNAGEYLFHSSDGGATWNRKELQIKTGNFRYLNEILFTQETDHVLLSKNQGTSFENHDAGFNAANIFQFTSANHTLWVNSNDGSYENKNGNQWPALAGFRNIERTEDGALIAIVNDTLKRSPDGGENWYTIPNTFFGTYSLLGSATVHVAGNIFYLSDRGYTWYSKDGGIVWEKFGTPVKFHQFVTHIAFDQSDYFASDDEGGLFKSLDGVVWENINYGTWDPLLISNKMVHCHNGYFYTRDTWSTYRLSPSENKWIYFPLSLGFTCMGSYGNLLFGGIYGVGVFLSRDNGDTWTDINYGLTDLQVNVIKVIDDKLYLGVDGGVWVRSLSDFNLFPYSGIVFNDENANGILDPAEPGLGRILVRMSPDQNTTSTSEDGQYSLFDDASVQDTIKAIAPSAYAIVTTPPIHVTAPSNQLNIGFSFIPGIYDAGISLTNLTALQPGFRNRIVISYKNNGTVSRDIEIHLTIPQEVQYLSSSIDPVIDADTLIWTIPSVSPGTTGSILVIIKIPTGVPIGNIIDFFADIPVLPAGDQNIADNSAILSLAVVGSYDPNDKAVFPAGFITPSMIADSQRMEYTIRFQNTGNHPASFVRIQDTLSSNLDLSTLEIISASHTHSWQLLPHRVLDIYFQNINLPDSTNDEQGSHGFIKYSIRVKPTLRLADRIENKGYIYFDFNSAIVTNTVGTTVSLETGIRHPEKTLSLLVSPNPVKDFLNITINDPGITKKIHLSLYDAKGTLIMSRFENSQNNIQMDVRKFPPGIYFLQATSGIHQRMIKLIKN